MSDIKYVLSVDSAGAVSQIKDFEKSLDGSGETADAAKPKFSGLWKEILGANFAYDMAKDAGRAFVQMIQQSIGNAVEDQQTQHELAESIRQTGRNYEIVGPQLEAFAAKMEQSTLYTDEQVRKASTLMVQMTDLDANGIQRAVKGSAGLAAVMGVDLESAARLVMKAMEGNYGALSRYGIKVDENLTAEQKQAALLDQLEKMYGRAESATQSYAGQLTQLKKAWENTKEEIGRVVLNTNILQASTGILTGALEQLQTVIKGVRGQLRELAEAKHAEMVADAAAYESLTKMADKIGWSHAKLYLLTQQYNLNYAQLREWIQGNMFGVAAADALAEAEGRLTSAKVQYTNTLKELGIPTVKEETKAEEERQRKLADLKLALDDGKISQEQYSKGVEELTKKEKVKAKAIEHTAAQIRALAVAKQQAKRATEELLRPGNELIAQQKEFQKTLDGIGQLELDRSNDQIPATCDALEEEAITYLGVADAVKMLADYSNALTPPEIKTWQDWQNEALEIVDRTIGALGSFARGMSSVNRQALSNTLENLNQEYVTRRKYIESTITDETLKAEAIAALDAEFEQRKLDAKRESARKQKALDTAQAITDTARAIIAAWKEPFPLNIAMAAMAAAVGAAQVAVIQQQPIPLATGAVFTEPTELLAGGRRYVAGESGLEVMATEATLRRIVRSEIHQAIRGGSEGGRRPITLPISIHLGTKKIGEEIIAIVQDGVDLGRLAIRSRNIRSNH